MVRCTLSIEKALSLLAFSLLAALAGCTSGTKIMTPDPSLHHAALKKAMTIPSMEPGSETEQAALKRFDAFYAEYSAAAITSGVREVYAEDAWFGDPFHVVEGIDDIEHYFLVMAEPVEECTFTVDSMQRSGSDYFSRWTMVLKSKAVKGEPIKAIGMSHVRYNTEGKIIFQQDYWDTSVMLDRIPVVGFWTRLVKGRIEKGLEQ